MSATEEYSKLYAQRPKFDPTRFDQSTKQGRILFQKEKERVENEAKQWDAANKPVLDALQARMQREGQGEAGQSAKTDEYNKYMASPEHINYQMAKAAALAGSGIGGTAFNMMLGQPATRHTTRLGRLGIMAPYALESLASLEAANKLNEQSKAEDNPRGKDITDVAQNALYGFSTGPAITGLRKGLSTKIIPGEKNPTPSPISSAPTPQTTAPAYYEGTSADVAREIAKDYGLTPRSGEPKKSIVDRTLEAIPNTHADLHRTVQEKMGGADPLTILKEIRDSQRRVKFGPTGKLGLALGLGAGAAAISPGEAEAATPREPAALTPKPEASSYSSDLSDEYGTGLSKGAAREALKGAAGTALAAAPVTGEAMMAAESPNLYKPSDEDLADAEYWQRGREEMANKTPQSSPVNPERHAFVPEHLPEHERGFLNNPAEAHERSKFLIPYLRAGAEARRRGEDFFGGSPRYDQELAALKHFYHGKPGAPVAPESDTAPEAPSFAKGGAVRKKINTIHDTFKHKLADKERMVSSLEKALERKPNPKLAKRLTKEKAEVERIREHLKKIQAHAA